MKHTHLILIGVITVAVSAAASSVTRFTGSTGEMIVQEFSSASRSSLSSEIFESASSAELISESSSIESSESSSSIEESSSSSSEESSFASSSNLSVVAESSSVESSIESISSESSESSVSSELSTSSESSASSDRLLGLKNLVLDHKEQQSMNENIAPSFLIPSHADISSIDELRERMAITLIGVDGSSEEQVFTVASESGSYRITLDPPRTFTPGRYRLLAELDRTRGVTRSLRRFFRLTNAAIEEDSLVLIDEYIDWGTTAKNPVEPQDDGLVTLKRTSVSQVQPGTTETMSIDITVAASMTAVIRETVPAEFSITDISPVGTVTVMGDTQQIEWNMQLEENVARTFSYAYTAGEDTPVFALFGPVEMRGVPERAIEDQEVIEKVEEISSASESIASFESSSSISSESSSSESSESFESSASSESSGSSFSSSSSDYSSSSSSSDSFASSASFESSSPALQSFIQSFFDGIASLFGSVTFDEDELFFTEDRRWQMLVSDEENFDEVVRERILMLERSAAVFDANAAPSFTLVQTDLESDVTVLDGSGNLLTKVALQEVLHSIVTESQMQDAVMKKILKDGAETIAFQTLEDRSVQRALQDVAGGASARVFEEKVSQVIASNAGAQEELTDIVGDNDLAREIVDEVINADLTDSILGKFAERGTEELSADDVISEALSEEGDSALLLSEAVVQAIVADDATTEVIRSNVDEAADTDSSDETQLIRVNLTGPDGAVIENVPFHFKVGSVVLVIDPLPAFRPGVYTVEVLITNPLTGETTPMYQQFAWGVLAMNSDKDRYTAGETARIDFGVLDDAGEIVCVADLTLDITAPDGSTEQLSTDDNSIETTGTCGLKEAGFIEPDFTTEYIFSQSGTYALTLTAKTPNGIRSISSEISVIASSDSAFFIKRTGATRLWPFAPSPMTIDVTFGADTDGMVSERVAPGFEIVETEPEAEVVTLDDGTTFIRWTGSWEAGETATFQYIYDAPDISPQFYLLGPVRILSDSPLSDQ